MAHGETVRFEKVGKSFGSTAALADFTLEVAAGEFVTLLGPSGSGKTTALNILAGFTNASEGRVFIGERDVTALPPELLDAFEPMPDERVVRAQLGFR